MSNDVMQKIHSNAAGIDIGSTNLHVSVDGQTVKVFTTYTNSLVEVVNYLKASGTETVAMEATGVLWIPLLDLIRNSGIKVFLVNGSQVNNVPAQKSDFQDCRWLQKLHTFGLLRASFVPEDEILELRTYMRARETQIDLSAESVQRMHKAFEMMNIKLHNVISDISGKSGLRIIEAILEGEYDANVLLQLCDNSILNKKSEEVKLSLVGNYKKEYIFMLRQAYESYKFIRNQIHICDKEISILLDFLTKDLPVPPSSLPQSSRHNHPQIDNLHAKIVQLLDGRNASVLPGINDKTLLKLVSELGTDLKNWATEKHFVSWLGLSPRKKQSGKMHKTKKQRVNTIAGQIFKESANSIAGSKYLALKGFYTRIKAKHGAVVANKATARKLAVLFYRFIRHGMEYVEQGLKQYEEKFKITILKNLAKKAKAIGYNLVEAV